jgi:hypothetical protein
MVLSRIELANNQSCAAGSPSFSNQDDDDGEEPSDTNDVDNEEPDDDGEASDTNDVDNEEPDDDGEASDTNDVDNEEPDDDDEASDTADVDNDSPSASICAPLQTGQVLVNLPLSGATKVIANAMVPAGTYTRLQANLRTVEVVGVFTDANGTGKPFTFRVLMNVVSAIRLDAPVTVEASTTNLTLDVGVRSWFTDRSGAVVDPTRAANHSVVERNIRASLRARS